ncbi:response regulator transcription factor [Emticicia sp.]|uniref:response regulator transcription factor n=1 Tax=Emticicia sp. TaxID=1930953 RepID=UPI00375382CF
MSTLTILIALKTPQEYAIILANLSNIFKTSFVIEQERNPLQKTQELMPDFIIIEGSAGITITKNIKAIPKCFTKCIVCFDAFDEDVLIHAFFTNADAYFLKTSTNATITDCVSRLLGGERYITPSFARNVLQNPKLDRYRSVTDKLSIRERDIFRNYGYQYSVKQIAEKLFISENTVNTHKKAIIKKLDLKNSRELKQLAAEFLNTIPQ